MAPDGLQMVPACAPFPACPLQSRITFKIVFLIMLPYYSDRTLASVTLRRNEKPYLGLQACPLSHPLRSRRVALLPCHQT